MASLWGYGILTFFAALLSWTWWTGRKREADLRSLAQSCGLQFIGKAMPSSVPVERLPQPPSAVWNVIDGDVRGVRVVVFDCRSGHGKGNWQRTLIAITGATEAARIASFDMDMTKEQIGSWVFLFYPRRLSPSFFDGLTPVREVRAYLESISG